MIKLSQWIKTALPISQEIPPYIAAFDSSSELRRFPLEHVQADTSMFLTQAEIEALPGFGGGSGAIDLALIQDIKPSSTMGGSSIAATYQTRDLNVVVFDTIGITLNANQITLPARDCLVLAVAPSYQSNRVHLQIYDSVQSLELFQGMTVSSNASDVSCIFAVVFGSVSASSTFEIRQWSQTARSGYGLGLESVGGSNSIFTNVFLMGV